MFIFLAILMQSYEDARRPQGTQGCCKTRKVFVPLSQELPLTSLLTNAVRLSHDYHAMTLPFIAQLPQEYYEPYDSPWSSHDCRTVKFGTVLQLWNHIWWQPCEWTQDIRVSIVRLP